MKGLKSCFSSILLMLLFANVALCLEPALIFEIPVEGRTVSGDVLDGRLILSSPEKFSILTSEGNESYKANLKLNEGIVASRDGNFYGITTYSKEASPGFLSAQRFELHSADGIKLWQIEHPQVSDFYISDDAKLVIGISSGEGSAESRLVFYDHTGDSIFSTKVAFPQGISFSSNGKYVLVNSGKDGLMAFDDKGNLKANLGLCDKFDTSPDGEFVAITSKGILKFFYQGKPIDASPKIDLLAKDMSFSPENKYLSLIDKKNLYLFEVQTGKLLWRHSLDQPELSFISVDVSPNAEKIIAGLDFDKGRKVTPEERHTTGFVYVFDKNGKITWKKELSYKLWGAMFPKVKFCSDGQRFSIITREKASLYKVWLEK